METLYPYSHLSNSNWLMQESHNSTIWTREENKRFERALAIYDKETPDRWIRVASMIPGKSAMDVKKQYDELEADVCEIEAGLVPTPGYLTSSFTMEFEGDRGFDVLRKRSSMGRSSDHERKKGVPWTEEEHRRFLMGLQKHGKGDWRNISRNFVISKTPTQVASHAQKYFLRQSSGVKDKRRPSIHDITTVNLAGTTQLENDDDSAASMYESSDLLPTRNISLDWNYSNDDSANTFKTYSCEMDSHGLSLQREARHGAHMGHHQNPAFRIQAARYRIRG